MLTFEQIKELIELVAERRLQGLEVERSGFKLRVDGYGPPVVAGPARTEAPFPEPPLRAAPPVAADAAAPAAREPAAEEPQGHILTSPIVGTFYRAPSPEADPFVSVGDRVKVGQVLCIVEAMKLMNEIEADVAGVVTEIFPKNAQPVEFGERLFAIDPD